MGKYEPLARYLERLPDDSWHARFAEVEKVLGFDLPKSAHQYQAWWANQESGHSQTEGWQAAGFETRELDLAGKRVRFVRTRRSRPSVVTDSLPPQPDLDSLWRKAAELSGISDREALERAAVSTFIKRTAVQKLIELGGTVPDFKAPLRERPFE